MSRYLSFRFGIDIPIGESAAANWFIWALGALSVEAALGVTVLPKWCYRRLHAGLALGCAIAFVQLLPFVNISWLHDVGWLLMNPAWALGFFILVNYAVAAEQRWRQASPRVPHWISALASIGIISYSLYLTHSFVIMHWYWFGFTRLHIRSITVLIMVPISVAFAWLYFRICERPFMTSTSKVRARHTVPREQEIELVRDVA